MKSKEEIQEHLNLMEELLQELKDDLIHMKKNGFKSDVDDLIEQIHYDETYILGLKWCLKG